MRIRLLVALWLAVVAVGISIAARYSSTPGVPAAAPSVWPETSLERDREHFTLVMLAHPKCPCTRASIAELSELIQRTGDGVRAYVLFVRPAGTPDGWERTDTWSSAASIPNVRVIRDDDGALARRFGAHVSGQTLVYDAAGRLVFEGGLTPARGHSADTTSRDRIAALVRSHDRVAAPVFGCDLEDKGSRRP